jgi:hypothetical protein
MESFVLVSIKNSRILSWEDCECVILWKRGLLLLQGIKSDWFVSSFLLKSSFFYWAHCHGYGSDFDRTSCGIEKIEMGGGFGRGRVLLLPAVSFVILTFSGFGFAQQRSGGGGGSGTAGGKDYLFLHIFHPRIPPCTSEDDRISFLSFPALCFLKKIWE